MMSKRIRKGRNKMKGSKSAFDNTELIIRRKDKKMQESEFVFDNIGLKDSVTKLSGLTIMI